MTGTFILGETKVRPGAYFNIQKKGNNPSSGIMNGVTAVIFRADFGPLNTAVELNAEDGYEDIYGNALTTDALKEAFAGGAKTIIACRVGNGGEKGSVTLKGTVLEEEKDAAKLTALYPGTRQLAVTIRKSLENEAMKDVTIYDGTKQLETVSFVTSANDVVGLEYALSGSKYVKVEVLNKLCCVKEVQQKKFDGGVEPAVTSGDYSNAFAQVEPYDFNTICLDTEEPEIHLLLQSFMKRIFETGSLTQAVVAEKHTVELEARMKHAAAFNDEKMNYVLNAYIDEQGKEIDGYQTAARIAGMIGAAVANSSLTHTVINGFSEIKERLTNSEITAAEKKGCLVLSYNKSGQVWIDNAINTLITPADNQDDGWKKIRRVKTRFELIRRINNTADDLVGKVDNDTNGRQTVISQLQGVGDDMRAEGKLVACTVTESSTNVSDGDSAWFDIDVIDKDSMEHIYLIFTFRFSTREE